MRGNEIKASAAVEVRLPPKIGEAVQYTAKDGDGRPCAAIVTEVDKEKGTVGLFVLRSQYSSVSWEIDVREGTARGEFRRIA